MAISSSFQAQGNRAARTDTQIFGFVGLLDESVCEAFPAPTFCCGNFRKFSRKFASSDGKDFPEKVQSKQGKSYQGQVAGTIQEIFIGGDTFPDSTFPDKESVDSG